jgi:adenylyltransferase/sulfurtransferase
MLSDAAVAARKPLVSGAALRLDAQLLVLNQPPGEGPCYRCVFPRPPHLGGEGGVAAPTCADAGVLGPVVGMMGCLMAAKALLLLLPPPAPSASAPAPACRTANSSESQPPPSEPAAPLAPAFDPDVDPAREMLVFAAAATPPFRSVRLRGRRAGCLACGAAPSADVKEQWMVEAARAYDPPAFCAPVPANGTPVGGLPNPRQEGELPQQPPRVTARELAASEADGRIVLDVRPRAQFDLCALRGAVSAPWDELAPGFDRQRWLEHAREAILSPHGRGQTEQQRVYVVCRNGNDSQAAARALSEDGLCAGGGRWIGDVVGGLKAWRDEVDADFPEY